MKQIPRDIYIGLAFFLVVLMYGAAGVVVQSVNGSLGVTLGEAASMMFVFAAVVGGAAFVAALWLTRFLKAKPDAKVALKGVASAVTAVALVLGAIAGVQVSRARNAEQDRSSAAAADAKQKVADARAAEALRVASLSPEQLSAEKATKEAAVQAARESARKTQEAAAEAAQKQALATLREAVAIEALSRLRAAMKDPDSFEVKEVLLMDTGSACYTYRARNSFNAMLQNHAVLSVSIPKAGAKSKESVRMAVEGVDGFSSAWNKSCANQSGKDITRMAKRALSVG